MDLNLWFLSILLTYEYISTMSLIKTYNLFDPKDCSEIIEKELTKEELEDTSSINHFMMLEDPGYQKNCCRRTTNKSFFSSLCETGKNNGGNFGILFNSSLEKNPLFGKRI